MDGCIVLKLCGIVRRKQFSTPFIPKGDVPLPIISTLQFVSGFGGDIDASEFIDCAREDVACFLAGVDDNTGAGFALGWGELTVCHGLCSLLSVGVGHA